MTERLNLLNNWLRIDLDLKGYSLTPASEDASFRRYFRVSLNSESYIVMDAPPDKEDCQPFIDITERLLECNVNAPEIKARDLDKGFLLLTDLGAQLYLHALTETNADTLYTDAIEAILKIQTGARLTGLPRYDARLLREEMTLFRDWLLTKHLCFKLTDKQQKSLDKTISLLIHSALEQPQVFVHRDYHSRNLLYNENHDPGILDFQDAVIGPVTYDLVSLFKDCYIKWPRTEINRWVHEYYHNARVCLGIQSSEKQFMRWFDLMGVQRQLKASGIFARLYHRDNKSGYLKDIPRTLSYIIDLDDDYPELADLITLIREDVLPALDNKQSQCTQ